MGVKERLSAEEASAPTLIAVEHRHRYRFAGTLLGGRRILDLCCGTGYGAMILSESAAEVHGVDNDGAAIDAADARASGPVSFEAADALDFLRQPDIAERFDAIVCFEGLEHVQQLDAVMERLRELADGGMTMILSVPNSKGLGEDNEFHETDFSYEEAVERIGSFPRATMLTQSLAEGSLLVTADAEGADLDATVVLDERDEPEYANHFVFCIGVEPGSPDGIMHLQAAPAANRYMANLEQANAELRRANQRLLRDRLGRSDSGAGSFVAKYEEVAARLADVEPRLEESEDRARAWIERCLGAEAREQELRERLARSDARLGSTLVHVMAKATRSLRRR